MSAQSTQPILVTGGAGYIGSHMAWLLKARGLTPVIVDNLSTGNAFAAEKFGPFEQGDVGDAAFIRAVCDKYKPQAVIHFAAFSLVGESVSNPEKYHTNNTAKAKILFETALACGVRHVVFSSTAATYGSVTHGKPITENDPTAPINPYGESKLNTEKFLRSLEGQGLTSVALRYFNAAGAAPAPFDIGEAHAPETHLIPLAIMATQGGAALTVFGTDYPTPDGTAIRDYIHVEDLAEAHILALDYLSKGGKSDAFNLGTGTGNSVLEVIKTVESVTGRKVDHSFGPRRAGDPALLVADAGKAKNILGWAPTRNLSDIVSSATAWHSGATYSKFYQAKLKT